MRRSQPQSRGATDYALMDNDDEGQTQMEGGREAVAARVKGEDASVGASPGGFHMSTDVEQAAGMEVGRLDSPPTQTKRARFLDRTGRFSQSLGRLNVKRLHQPRMMARRDWVHQLLHQKTSLLLCYCFILCVRGVAGV